MNVTAYVDGLKWMERPLPFTFYSKLKLHFSSPQSLSIIVDLFLLTILLNMLFEECETFSNCSTCFVEDECGFCLSSSLCTTRGNCPQNAFVTSCPSMLNSQQHLSSSLFFFVSNSIIHWIGCSDNFRLLRQCCNR